MASIGHTAYPRFRRVVSVRELQESFTPGGDEIGWARERTRSARSGRRHGGPLSDKAARDGAVRDYRASLQTVATRTPATINTVLAAIADFYARRGLGAPEVRRLDMKNEPATVTWPQCK
jgi:hypothetical protein